jgi:hypothetical protein
MLVEGAQIWEVDETMQEAESLVENAGVEVSSRFVSSSWCGRVSIRFLKGFN